MTRYYRQLGFLAGAAAHAAVEQRQALLLAGGPLAFTLIEIIDRDADGRVMRRIESAAGFGGALRRLSPAYRPWSWGSSM